MLTGDQIIADHTVVDKYDDIPEYYIEEVKKMVLSVWARFIPTLISVD